MYIDDSLQMLAQSNVECYICHVFIGALAYADNVVLLAPTASAMHMLRVCEEYAINFSVKFNPSKSEYIVCEIHPKLKPTNVNRSIILLYADLTLRSLIVGHV